MDDIFKRRGIFEIDDAALRNAPDVIQGIMSRIIVVRCEHMAITGKYEYAAYSMLFDPVEDCMNTPKYVITFSGLGDSLEVGARKA